MGKQSLAILETTSEAQKQVWLIVLVVSAVHVYFLQQTNILKPLEITDSDDCPRLLWALRGLIPALSALCQDVKADTQLGRMLFCPCNGGCEVTGCWYDRSLWRALRGQAIKAGPDITLTAPLDSRLRLPYTLSTCHHIQQKHIHLLKSFKLTFSLEETFSLKPRTKSFHWGRSFKNFLKMSLGVIHDRIKQMQITRKSVKQDDLHRKQEKLSQGKVRHVYL